MADQTKPDPKQDPGTVDRRVNSMVDSVASTNQTGFGIGVIDAHGSRRVTVRKLADEIQQVGEYVPPALIRNHDVYDTGSLVEYAKKYGTPADSLIMVGRDVVTLTLNETIQRGDREQATMTVRRHEDWLGWQALIQSGDGFTHRDLMRQILRLGHTIDDTQIVTSMRSVKMTSTAKFDSDVREDGDTVGVIFTSSGGDEIKKFPRQFRVTVPVLEDDPVDGVVGKTMWIRVEVMMPTTPSDALTFHLSCPEWEATFRQRLADEVAKIRVGLPGWTIVRGEHGEEDRRVENKALVATLLGYDAPLSTCPDSHAPAPAAPSPDAAGSD